MPSKKRELPLRHMISRLLQRRCVAHHQPRVEVTQDKRCAADPSRAPAQALLPKHLQTRLDGCFKILHAQPLPGHSEEVYPKHISSGEGALGPPSPASRPQALHGAGTGCRRIWPLAQRDATAPEEQFPLCRSWYTGCSRLQKALQAGLLHRCLSFCTSQRLWVSVISTDQLMSRKRNIQLPYPSVEWATGR